MIKLRDILREAFQTGQRVLYKGRKARVKAIASDRLYLRFDDGTSRSVPTDQVQNLSEAKTTRFYIRHPLDITKAIRVLKAADIEIEVGINNVIRLDSKDVPEATKVLGANRVDFETTRKRFKIEAVAPKWKHGSPEMAKHLKSLHAKGEPHGIPTVRNGKIVCSTCGKEYIQFKGGSVHPDTPAEKYLRKKGVIK